MFTGLVQESALITHFEKSGSSLWRLKLKTKLNTSSWSLGASIAINGVCLTLVEKVGDEIHFELSQETLQRSNFSKVKASDRAHIESSLKVGDPLGGHWVLGHVDGVGTIVECKKLGETLFLKIQIKDYAREQIAPYLVEKGSICVDGVSLTVNAVADDTDSTDFDLLLIPHTLEVTRFADLKVGDLVNLEADIMAKYAARLYGYKQAFERRGS